MGVGCMGQFYVYMDMGVMLDILMIVKVFGNGFLIGVMLMMNELVVYFKVGVYGMMYGGNLFVLVIVDKVVELIGDLVLFEGVCECSVCLKGVLECINVCFGIFKDVCGKGLLVGVEFIVVFDGCVKDFVIVVVENGLIMLIVGLNVLCFVLLLVILFDLFDEGVKCFEKVVEQVFVVQEVIVC